MDYKYKFTVFTPCYNSEKFIHRVYDSLKTQTFKDFEWLVIDDASTDQTISILKSFQLENIFNIKIVENKKNQMITRNFNDAFLLAEGELFIPLGHDDMIEPESLEQMDIIWSKHKKDNISGIWSMCKDQFGNLIGNYFDKDLLIDNYFNLFINHIYTKEKFLCVRTDIVQKYNFEENHLEYIPEGLLWGRIALRYDTIFVNNIFRTYYLEPDNLNALTKRSRKKLSESVMYQNAIWINEFFPALKDGLKFKLRTYFAFAYYSFLSQESLMVNLSKINHNSHKLLIITILPVAFLVYLKNEFLNKN